MEIVKSRLSHQALSKLCSSRITRTKKDSSSLGNFVLFRDAMIFSISVDMEQKKRLELEKQVFKSTVQPFE
jgi:hypothetical protein